VSKLSEELDKMKAINVEFDDLDFKMLEQHKGKRTWREFILWLSEEVKKRC